MIDHSSDNRHESKASDGNRSHQKFKAACLLIHGFTGTPWAMQELADSLRELNILTHVPLLPGHGVSADKLAQVSWQDWVNTARTAFEKLSSEYETCFVIGHSVGGAIALLLAAEFPVQGVITLSAPYRFEDRRLVFLPLLLPFIANWKKRHKRADGLLPPDIGYNCYPLKAVVECQRLLKVMRRRLTEIESPLLMIHSRQDYRVSVKNMHQIARKVNSSDMWIRYLDAPAHTVTKGPDREEVIQVVQEFISQQSGMG